MYRQADRYINQQTQRGFSLIELAMVLFIVSLLVAGLLGPLSIRVEQRERLAAVDEMAQIEESLYGFAISNGRLICPDCTNNAGDCGGSTANDGLEDRFTNVDYLDCAADIGNLPWVDLAVNQFDPWDRQYMYRVSDDFADGPDDDEPDRNTALACFNSNTGTSFALCSQGDITVQDRGSTCPGTAPGGLPVANNIPALVFTQGKKLDTESPLSCYEQENTDGDTVFVSTNYSQHEGADATDPDLNFYFDDIVIWISPHILMNRMVNAGRLP